MSERSTFASWFLELVLDEIYLQQQRKGVNWVTSAWLIWNGLQRTESSRTSLDKYSRTEHYFLKIHVVIVS